MAHNLEIKNGKASMAYTGEKPWHGLGQQVSDKMTPEQMLVAANLDWTVSKRDLFMQVDGKHVKVKDKFMLARDNDDAQFSVVGTTYKPVQNATAADFLKKFTSAGHMNMETMGGLWGGRYIWALARLNKDFKLGKEDEVRGYMLICQPHVIGKAMVIQFTPTRVVCWNTLTYALGGNLKGNKNAFRMPHSQEFNDTVRNAAEEALGLGQQQMDEFKEAATYLTSRRMTAPKVEEYFCEVLKFDPKQQEKTEEKIREPLLLAKFRTALEYSPGHDLRTAEGTAWGALNAVTFVIDHEIGRDRDTALKTAWLGNKATVKRRAFNLAMDYAKKSKAA